MLVRLSASLADGNRREIFLRWLAGQTQSRIADELQVTRQAVSASLWGDRRYERGGSIEAMRSLCLRDDEFLRVAAGRSHDVGPVFAGFPVEWFAGLNAGNRSFFVPLVVLFVFSQLADRKNQLSYSAARSILPAWVLSHGMPPLRALRYIDTDGVTIRIMRTPLTDARNA